MSNKWGIKPEQAETLLELENTLDIHIPSSEELKWNEWGVEIKEENIVGLTLFKLKLPSLPESIGNLNALKKLYLWNLELNFIPESIGNLDELKELNLWGNKLALLPESIGNLSELKDLNLKNNQLTSLPESIINLQSLQCLDLNDSKLFIFPDSIIKLGAKETKVDYSIMDDFSIMLYNTLKYSFIKLHI